LPRSGSSGRGGSRRRASTGDLSRIGVKERGRLAGGSGAPYLAPAGLALAAAIAAWTFSGRLVSCGTSLGSPETQIRKALANQSRAHLDDVYGFRAGGTVELHSVRFDDVAPSVEKGRATVVSMLTAEGRAVWRDQQARLSYLGRERFHMKPCSIALWCAEGDQFDRLRGVLLALFRRRDALERRDRDALGQLLSTRRPDRAPTGPGTPEELAGLAAQPRVLGWQIRVEREAAEVGEDLEIAPAGAGPRQERRLYHLVWERERWLFLDGP
jgi:hypothetical protein